MGIGVGGGCSRIWEAKDKGMRAIYYVLHIEGWGLERNVHYWAHIMDARLRKMDDRLSIEGCRLWITKA